MTCGQNCVDWAMSLVVAGQEGANIAMLAGMTPPHNHFEIAAMRDLALRDLGVTVLARDAAPGAWAREAFRQAADDDHELRNVVRAVSALCVAEGYCKDLFDFYLLDCAFDDIDAGQPSYHWDGANSENIMSLVRKRVDEFQASSVNSRV